MCQRSAGRRAWCSRRFWGRIRLRGNCCCAARREPSSMDWLALMPRDYFPSRRAIVVVALRAGSRLLYVGLRSCRAGTDFRRGAKVGKAPLKGSADPLRIPPKISTTVPLALPPSASPVMPCEYHFPFGTVRMPPTGGADAQHRGVVRSTKPNGVPPERPLRRSAGAVDANRLSA